MVLGDLTTQENKRVEETKNILEAKLGQYLPAESFLVLVRNYSGDVRTRSSNQANDMLKIVTRPSGRSAALARKAELEAAGFQISGRGDVNLPENK
jgi:hypothetical protein